MRTLHGVLLVALGSCPHTFAQTCRPLCSFDSQYTQSCQISRWYTTALLERLQGDGVWGQIAAKSFSCESLNGSDCENATSCQVSGSGCAADRAWMARKLASPLWQGGASLGAKCGLLGQVMAGEAECMEMDEAACDSYNGTAGCLWDPVRSSCGLPPAVVLALLRQDFRDELVRLALRRERCASVTSQDLCKGSCWWDAAAMRCNLLAVEALLAVVDEDCPLRTVLSTQAACDELSEESCRAAAWQSGSQDCIWVNGCQANPRTLEMVLLRQLGLMTAQMEDSMTSSMATCGNLTDCAQTPAFCVEDLPPLHGAAVQRASNVALPLLLLWVVHAAGLSA